MDSFFFFLSSLKFFYFFFPDRSAQPGKARAWAPAGWGPCLGSPAQHRGRGWAVRCLFTPNPTTESSFGDRGGMDSIFISSPDLLHLAQCLPKSIHVALFELLSFEKKSVFLGEVSKDEERRGKFESGVCAEGLE